MATDALSPYLVVNGADRAIAYYTRVFGARESYRLSWPDGRVGHAELRIGEALLMLADEHPDFGALGPASIGGTPVSLLLYVDDADAVLALGEEAGGTILRAAKDEFYGDRTGMLLDPFGHKWHLSTRREALSVEDIQQRWQKVLADG